MGVGGTGHEIIHSRQNKGDGLLLNAPQGVADQRGGCLLRDSGRGCFYKERRQGRGLRKATELANGRAYLPWGPSGLYCVSLIEVQGGEDEARGLGNWGPLVGLWARARVPLG